MSQILFNQAIAPSRPAAGITALYAFTDGNLYIQTSAVGPFQVLTTNSLTGNLTYSGTVTYNQPNANGIDDFIINNTAGNNSILTFQTAGVDTGYIGVIGTTGHFITGSTAGDLIITGIATTPNLDFSAAGSVINMKIASAGNVTISAPASGATLGVNSVSSGTAAYFADGTGQLGIKFDGSHNLLVGVDSGGSLSFYTNGSGNPHLTISSAGNVTIAAPSSGVALTVTGNASTVAAEFTNSGGGAAFFNSTSANGVYTEYGNSSVIIGYIGSGKEIFSGYATVADFGLSAVSNLVLGNAGVATPAISINSTNNVTIGPPSSGTTAFNVHGVNNSYTAAFNSGTTSGQAYGVVIEAGSTSGDQAIYCTNALGNAVYFMIRGDGQATISSAYYANGNLSVAAGVITSSSDERIKTNVRPFIKGMETISKIHPILYGWDKEKSGIDSPKDDFVGFSAQNIQSIMPEAVDANAEGILGMSDKAVIAALVNAVKEQQNQIDTQQEQINSLINEIAALKAQQQGIV